MDMGLFDFVTKSAAYEVADFAELKAIPPGTLGNQRYRTMRSQGTGLKGALFYYDATTVLAEALPLIAIPNGITRPTAGGWINMTNNRIYSNAAPSAAPPFRGTIWVADLTAPTRRIEYEAIGTSGVGDWRVTNTPISQGSGPPDHVPVLGERYIDTSTGEVYTATGTSNSTWMNDSVGGGGGT